MTAGNDSTYAGVIRFGVDNFEARDPLDTGSVKDGIVNNLEALYNGSAQIRANIMLTSMLPFGESINNPFEPGSFFENNMFLVTSVDFPLTVLKDGTPAPMYVEVCAQTLGTPGGSANVEVWTVLRYQGRSGFEPGSISSGWAQITSETPSWYTITNRANARPYLLIDAGPRVRTDTVKTRNHPGESRAAFDSTIVAAALDIYVRKAPGTTTQGIGFWGCFARESPWNAY